MLLNHIQSVCNNEEKTCHTIAREKKQNAVRKLIFY